jgi:hypothetical protein
MQMIPEHATFFPSASVWHGERYRSSIPTEYEMIHIAVGVFNIKGAIQNFMITFFLANQVVITVIHAKQCMLSFVGLSETVMVLLVEGKTARITGTRCHLHRT